MAAVAANQLVKRMEHGLRISYPIVASKRIYAGTMVFIVAASGYATDDDAAGANRFAGIATEEIDNSSGASGDKRVECWVEGIFELVGSSFTQADILKPIYAVDNFTIQTSATTASLVGTSVEFLSATVLRVKLSVNPT